MLNIDDITRQVLYNCDISYAYHAGLFSICGLALRLRDLYKWEKGLPAWEESDSSEVLEWIENKKLVDLNLWDGDKIFIPWLFQKECFSAKFIYEDGKYISHSVTFH